ncbi:hypothetical protein F5050DRAFT_1580251 [Lentinula boryana]|uniref:Uncharacterized protein n=1 Tax=Lentinula boryana TaxID=40481 RepID=A0ABQ8Q018_9AGAR|nr:hypothetical protein F5050DRAFT_1580251 [Lentinula boryana]
MSRKDGLYIPPSYSPKPYTREEPPQRPKTVPLQSEQSGSSVSGAFFAGAHNFDVNGGAFHNAAGDINSTVHNDHSVKSDFNNDYKGAARYNGAHNDYKGSSNYNGAHNDYKGSTNYNGAHSTSLFQLGMIVTTEVYVDDFLYNVTYLTFLTVNKFDDQNARRKFLEAAPSRAKPELYSNSEDELVDERERPEVKYDYMEGFRQTRREFHEDFQFQHELGSNRKTSNGESQRPATPEEVEEPGAAQLRQCVQKFLATKFSGKGLMSDLADTLINADWDRETLAESEWGDVKDVYKGPGWTSPMFVRLRKICREWDM